MKKDYLKKLFASMINKWRKLWGQGDFPFIYAQLSNYDVSYPNEIVERFLTWLKQYDEQTSLTDDKWV